ncbi:MAG: thioredoxin domain-containing protein [Myxococcales bacterium]|nr:thioredoxin domain-containing protein [Myxococcales bacterium]
MRLPSWLLFVALTGCGLGLSSRPERTDVADTGKSSGTTQPETGGTIPRAKDPPRALPGVSTEKLSEERQQAFWDVASRLYAPCTDQAVTLVQCMEEARPCGGCQPMANLVAEQVQRGMNRTNAAAAATTRFSPDAVKSVPLRNSPSKGPANAAVTIVVFSDFECPACGAAVPLLSEVADKYPNDVRLVHKYFPLEKHLRAKAAAKAAFAAQKQNKYWAMEKLIFENQSALADEDLDKYAEKVGLDMAQYRLDKASAEAEEVIERDIADGDAAGLKFTPFVLVNGRLFDPNFFRYDRDLEPWILTEKQLVEAKPKKAAE